MIKLNNKVKINFQSYLLTCTVIGEITKLMKFPLSEIRIESKMFVKINNNPSKISSNDPKKIDPNIDYRRRSRLSK